MDENYVIISGIRKKESDEKLKMFIERAYIDLSVTRLKVEPVDVLRKIRELAAISIGLESMFFSSVDDKQDFLAMISNLNEITLKKILQENKFNFYFEGVEYNPIQTSLF